MLIYSNISANIFFSPNLNEIIKLVKIMNYGQKMKEIRQENHLTQNDIAKLLSIARSTYKQYEKQYDIIPISHLNIFCNSFKISIDYILSLTNVFNYSKSKQVIDLKTSGLRIKELRKEHNLTQAKLAAKLNIANTMLCEYEKGHYPISTASLYTLAKLFNVSCDYLLGKTNIKYLTKEIVPN